MLHAKNLSLFLPQEQSLAVDARKRKTFRTPFPERFRDFIFSLTDGKFKS